MKRMNVPAVVTCEPGGTELGRELRTILLNKVSLSLAGKAEMLLFLADRAQHVEEVIRPALETGKVVLCDRYADATMAYQGYGRSLDAETIERFNAFATAFLVPDKTFLFDLPAEVGMARASGRSRSGTAADRFEGETLDFHRKIRQGYLDLARKHARRFVVLNGQGDVEDIHGEICRHLNAFMSAR